MSCRDKLTASASGPQHLATVQPRTVPLWMAFDQRLKELQ